MISGFLCQWLRAVGFRTQRYNRQKAILLSKDQCCQHVRQSILVDAVTKPNKRPVVRRFRASSESSLGDYGESLSGS
ncbi:hypothetical protein M8C21_025638 [Ambrosia artemisiifolia]|uniref:Uncharacterized protein n=1 Tax=Ambrosia artemisiifolia TaxID=4212 RepID=A0AAD5BV59_AMBAR|nr:hypothetical protein M8C21_025638 [Ambrosia artemisiifolia]